MAYYNKKYRKSYGLGDKPIVVLRKQLERTLIKDIDLMQKEIENLETKRIGYLDYKKRRIQYECQAQLIIEPLQQERLILIRDDSNYKSGIKYLFKKREIKDEINLKITHIENQIKETCNALKEKFNVTKSPYDNYEINAKEIDSRIDYQINRQILYYRNAIETYHSELKLKQDKNQQFENIKGIAAQALNKTRQRANQIKSNMISNDFCPYCGKHIEVVHVDHIYPVAKGGLSATKNMVEVCSLCNLKKKDLTLNQFIKKYKLDRDFVEGNLDMLNKSY